MIDPAYDLPDRDRTPCRECSGTAGYCPSCEGHGYLPDPWHDELGPEWSRGVAAIAHRIETAREDTP